MSAVFPSKVDGKFALAALTLPCIALIAIATAPHRGHLLWIPICLVVLAAVFVCWIFLATYYELRGDELLVRSGPFTWRIPLAEVTGIRESTSTRSGPALSMDRLEIVYGRGRRLIISPADKARFMAACRKGAGPLVQVG